MRTIIACLALSYKRKAYLVTVTQAVRWRKVIHHLVSLGCIWSALSVYCVPSIFIFTRIHNGLTDRQRLSSGNAYAGHEMPLLGNLSNIRRVHKISVPTTISCDRKILVFVKLSRHKGLYPKSHFHRQRSAQTNREINNVRRGKSGPRGTKKSRPRFSMIIGVEESKYEVIVYT